MMCQPSVSTGKCKKYIAASSTTLIQGSSNSTGNKNSYLDNSIVYNTNTQEYSCDQYDSSGRMYLQYFFQIVTYF